MPVVEELLLASAQAVAQPSLGSLVLEGQTVEKGKAVLGECKCVLGDR